MHNEVELIEADGWLVVSDKTRSISSFEAQVGIRQRCMLHFYLCCFKSLCFLVCGGLSFSSRCLLGVPDLYELKFQGLARSLPASSLPFGTVDSLNGNYGQSWTINLLISSF